MKKLKLFMLTFMVMMCGTLVFAACGEKDPEDNPPVVAVESTINPQLSSGNTWSTNNTLGNVPISPSVGDTPGDVTWKTPTITILAGEHEYEWVFTPEDTQRYLPASGTLKIIGLENYDLSIQFAGLSQTEEGESFIASYGQNVGLPMIIGYTGPSELVSVDWKFYNKNNEPLNSMPTEIGSYKIKAVVTIEGREDPIVTPIVDFIIEVAEVTDFGLSIADWTYGSDANVPQVNENLTNKVAFYYSTSENGDYSNQVPTEAGTYYLKAVMADSNYEGESTPIQFNINKASYTDINIEMKDWVYGETASVVSVNSYTFEVEKLSKTVTYAIQGSDDYTSDVPSNAGKYTVKVVIGASADGNYKETEFTANFEIKKATILSMTYEDITDILFEENLTVESISLEDGWVWDTTASKYNEVLKVGPNQRVAIYTQENYEPFTLNINIIVSENPNVTTEAALLSALSNDSLTTININEDITLTSNTTISSSKTIVVASGKTLTVGSNVDFVIYEGVEIEGNFVNNGTLTIYTTDISNLSLNPAKIILTENIENKTLTFTSDSAINCEIDLNAKTLTNVVININHPSDNDNTFDILLKNGSITSETNCINITGQSKTAVTLEKINATADGHALYINSTTSGAKINTTNSTLTGGAILLGSNTYKFTDCGLSGNNALYIKGGNIELTNCAITGTGEIVESPSEDLTATGYAIHINASENVSLKITSGTLETTNSEILIREYQTTEKEVEIAIEVEVDGITTENIYCNNDSVGLTVL